MSLKTQQRINFLSVEHEVPHVVASAVFKQACVFAIVSVEALVKKQEKKYEATLGCYVSTWLMLAEKLEISEPKMEALLYNALEQAMEFLDLPEMFKKSVAAGKKGG